MEELSLKTCSKCKIRKVTSEFNYAGNTKDKLQYKCKGCKKEYRLKSKLIPKVTPASGNKLCTVCRDVKELRHFTKHSGTSDGHYTICSSCKKGVSEEYRAANKDVIKKHSKKYYQANAEHIKDLGRKYYVENKEMTLHRNNLWRLENKERNRFLVLRWHRNKRKESPCYRLNMRIRSLILNAFKINCHGEFSKSKKTLEILGCTINEFKEHIERQFLDWMTWENQGNRDDINYKSSWHLDHIIPISYAKTEADICMLNHWSNFQPMCRKLNRDKSSKVYPLTNLELGITITN
jgi:hypothetical protein